MTNAEKLETLRHCVVFIETIEKTQRLQESLDYAIQCIEAVQRADAANEAKAKSWDGAPKWANCRAKDQVGEWIYLDFKPYADPDEEMIAIQHSRGMRMTPTIVRWIATLEERP
jgi:hypothetical protein